jgi:hypothetical protein
MTLRRCVGKPPPHSSARLWDLRWSHYSSGTRRPKGCICSINTTRTLKSVARIGLSGERTVTVAADGASASCTQCIVQACKMLKETEPAR